MLDEEIGIYLEQSMIANETIYNVKDRKRSLFIVLKYSGVL